MSAENLNSVSPPPPSQSRGAHKSPLSPRRDSALRCLGSPSQVLQVCKEGVRAHVGARCVMSVPPLRPSPFSADARLLGSRFLLLPYEPSAAHGLAVGAFSSLGKVPSGARRILSREKKTKTLTLGVKPMGSLLDPQEPRIADGAFPFCSWRGSICAGSRGNGPPACGLHAHGDRCVSGYRKRQISQALMLRNSGSALACGQGFLGSWEG